MDISDFIDAIKAVYSLRKPIKYAVKQIKKWCQKRHEQSKKILIWYTVVSNRVLYTSLPFKMTPL